MLCSSPFCSESMVFLVSVFFLQFEDFLEIAFNLYLAQRVDQNIRLFPKPFVLFKFSENWGYSHCEMTLHHCTDLDRNLSDFMGCFCLVYRLLLIIGILCCCSTGYFIRRRVHPYPPRERPDLTWPSPDSPSYHQVISPYAFVLHTCITWSHSLCVYCPCVLVGLRHGFHNYGDSETAVISTVYPVQTHPGHVTAVYSALPSHYRQPPPSYDQVMQDTQKK